MSGGIEKLREQLADIASSNVLMAYENWQIGMESPIERLLFIGMYSLIPMQEVDIMPLLKCETTSTDDLARLHPMQTARIAEHGTLLIQMQLRLLDWKADFVLSCPSITTKKAIIECDGHAFHERTKEQAARDRARDRAAQTAGYLMLRYTGSEIYRDPLGCARAALKAYAKSFEAEWFDGLGLNEK